MKEMTIEGKCVGDGFSGCVIDSDYGCLHLPPFTFNLDKTVTIHITQDDGDKE